MLEELRRLVMIGIGGTALAVDKVADYVDDLVEQGKLTVDEGKKLTEELIRNKKKDPSKEEREEIEIKESDDDDIEDLTVNIEGREDEEVIKENYQELSEDISDDDLDIDILEIGDITTTDEPLEIDNTDTDTIFEENEAIIDELDDIDF